MKKNKSPANITLQPDEVLQIVLEGTAAETGEAFFRALVQNLAIALKVIGAWVTDYIEESSMLRARAFWLNGIFVPHYEYHIAGTPCEPVIRKKDFFHVPERIFELFPDNPGSPIPDPVSYMGAPLLDVDGRLLGHLAVLDNHVMPEGSQNVAFFKIFAARASAELRRLRAEAEVLERERQLSNLLESAMDAVLEIDSKLLVTRTNPAADRVFQCSEGRLLGQSLTRFLTIEGRKKLQRHMHELGARPAGKQSLWIPAGLRAVCCDSGEFQAEATLSRYELRRQVFHVLILRNVNDRLEAEKKIQALTTETKYLREEIRAMHNFDAIIGQSEPLLRVLHQVKQVAATHATVLLLGETGTGKEIIARAIHAASERKDKPLIKINCAAIPATLIESELFGHEKGAFSGATSKREGRFTLADAGTIFLDEIGEMPLDLQVKLLRVLQEGEFEPVGSPKTVTVDVRVIAATNRNLHGEVERGNFREDLYYRLNVFPITVPPLRERCDDIALLAPYFAKKSAQKLGREIQSLTPEDILYLQSYDWPGNVRELQNIIERSVITSREGLLDVRHILPEASTGIELKTASMAEPRHDRVITIEEWKAMERSNIINALESTGWKIAGENGAARLLGIPPTTLYSRLKALNIQRLR